MVESSDRLSLCEEQLATTKYLLEAIVEFGLTEELAKEVYTVLGVLSLPKFLNGPWPLIWKQAKENDG